MSLETFGVVEVRKGSLCVRPKLGLEKRKGPGEKKRSMLPTSSVLGRAVKRSRKAGVCFLLPFPASQETRAQAVPPLFTPTGSNGSPRRGVASEAIPPLGSLQFSYSVMSNFAPLGKNLVLSHCIQFIQETSSVINIFNIPFCSKLYGHLDVVKQFQGC